MVNFVVLFVKSWRSFHPSRGFTEAAVDTVVVVADTNHSAEIYRRTHAGNCEPFFSTAMKIWLIFVALKAGNCDLYGGGGGYSKLEKDWATIRQIAQWTFPKRVEDLKKLDTLCISLDGDRESHDANRGEGSYDKAVAAVELALDHGLHTRIHMTLTKNNIGSLEYLADFSRRMDVPLHVGNVEFIENHPDVKLTDD